MDVDNAATPDSIPPGSPERYTLQEVVVTATHEPVTGAVSPLPVRTLSGADLLIVTGPGVSALAKVIPGASARSYGGPASVQTLTVRGLAPENTLVLLDGIRWNSPQNALADLALLRPGMFDRAEVSRGGNSALHGADAVGGTVLLTSASPGERFSAGASVSAGSSDMEGADLRLAGRVGGVGVSFSGGTSYGRGDYRYRYSDGLVDTLLRRSGADYRLMSGAIRAEAGDSTGPAVRVLAVLIEADRGSPPAATSVVLPPAARLADRQAAAALSARLPGGGGAEWRLRASWMRTRQEYTDPAVRLQGQSLRALHHTSAVVLAPELGFDAGETTRMTAGAELARNAIRSTSTAQQSRVQGSIHAGADHLWIPGGGLLTDLRLYPSVRFDAYSDAPPQVHPRLGVNAGLGVEPLVRVRAAVSADSRLPTFNERFWEPGGNPGLRPERSLSTEAGLLAGLEAGGRWEAQVTAFRVATTDRIVWLPGGGGIWSPRNLRSVLSQGVEGELSWSSPGGEVRLSVNGAFLDARRLSGDFPGDPTAGKRLPFVSRASGGGMAVIRAGPLHLSTLWTWTGSRYEDEANERSLPAHGTADLGLRFVQETGPLTWFIEGWVFNVFDASTVMLPQYPLPLREFRVTFGVHS